MRILNSESSSVDYLYAWFFQKVDYPLELDIFDLCSDDLRKKLETPRQVCDFYIICRY